MNQGRRVQRYAYVKVVFANKFLVIGRHAIWEAIVVSGRIGRRCVCVCTRSFLRSDCGLASSKTE